MCVYVFCRGGKDRDGEMRYNPFRITPYLLKVQGLDKAEQQPCCLALAERIISGYEGASPSAESLVMGLITVFVLTVYCTGILLLSFFCCLCCQLC